MNSSEIRFCQNHIIHNENNVLPAPSPFLRRFQSLHAGFHRGKQQPLREYIVFGINGLMFFQHYCGSYT